MLLVIGWEAAGAERLVTVLPTDPIEMRVEAPTSDPNGPAPLGLYARVGQPIRISKNLG